MVIKGCGVEDADTAGGTRGVVEVLLGTSIVVGVAGVGSGIVDGTSGIGGVGACGRDSVECSTCDTSSACGASSAYGGFATSTE